MSPTRFLPAFAAGYDRPHINGGEGEKNRASSPIGIGDSDGAKMALKS